MLDPALAAQLARIELALDSLSEDMHTLLARGRLPADERAVLARLMPMIAAVVDEEAFTIADLTAVPSLAPALDSPKAIGRLLLRAQGVRIDGYRVERLGRDRDGVLWRLFRR